MKNIIDAAGLEIKKESTSLDFNVIFIKKDNEDYYYNIFPLYIYEKNYKKAKDLVPQRIKEWLIRRGYTLEEVNKMPSKNYLYSIEMNVNNDDFITNNIMADMIKRIEKGENK